MQSDDYDEEVSSVEQTPAKGLREVNRANILNYESDSSEVEDGEDSAEMMPKISKSQQKNQPKAFDESKNVWGATKKSFYQSKGEADSDASLSSSEAEEDQLKEAERLAQIRRQKLARQLA